MCSVIVADTVDKLQFRSKLHHHSYASDVDTHIHTHIYFMTHTSTHSTRERFTHTHTHLFHDTHMDTLYKREIHTHTYFITHTHTHTHWHILRTISSFSQSLLLIFLSPSLIVWNALVSLVCVPILRSIGTRQLKCFLVLPLLFFVVVCRRYNTTQSWGFELPHTSCSSLYLVLSVTSLARTRISKTNRRAR